MTLPAAKWGLPSPVKGHLILEPTVLLQETIPTASTGGSPLALDLPTSEPIATAIRRTRRNCSTRLEVLTRAIPGAQIVVPPRKLNGYPSISALSCASNVAGFTALWGPISPK